jgi:hypothetical protein
MPRFANRQRSFLLLPLQITFLWFFYWESRLLLRQTRTTSAWFEMDFSDWSHAAAASQEATSDTHSSIRNHTTNTTSIHSSANPPVTVSFGAYFPNWSLGYIADPEALLRSRYEFIQQHASHETSFLNLLLHYHVSPNENTTKLLNICSKPAGVLDEAPEGVELLTRQIQIASSENHSASNSPNVRLLCAIYTHPPMHSLARVAALTYGYKCDGFLAFSTETVPELGLIHVHHAGLESYQNMWQKVRSIWMYIREHYSEDYDFFHLGGDDMYVLVENMRQFLASLPNDEPLHLGQWVRQRNHPYVAGGPGYTLNRRALVKLVDDSLPHCHEHTVAPFEDKLVSECLRNVGVFPFDTRHIETGQQRYHAGQPATVYTARAKQGRGASFQARAVAYFESLPHPSSKRFIGNNQTTRLVGPLYGLNAAAPDSVSFHNIHNPVYMGRMHAILYPNACPTKSAMAQSLLQHRNSAT